MRSRFRNGRHWRDGGHGKWECTKCKTRIEADIAKDIYYCPVCKDKKYIEI